MTPAKHTYLFSFELILTFFLMTSIIIFAHSLFKDFTPYLLVVAVIGFITSWFNKDKNNVRLIEGLINAGAIGVLLWTISAIAKSSLLFNEVISLCLKSGILIAVIFSFYANHKSLLRCIQALSVPLFMCTPIIVTLYYGIHLVLAGVYLTSWVAIIRIKFYSTLAPSSEEKSLRLSSFSGAIAFFSIALIASWFIFSQSKLTAIKNAGFFMRAAGGFGTQENELESQYRLLEQQLQEQIIGSLDQLREQGEKNKIIYQLSNLIKDSPEVIKLKNAEHDLYDHLQRPGPGEEEVANKQPDTFSLERYMDKKVELIIQNIQTTISEELKRSSFNAAKWFSILNKTNKLIAAQSLKETEQYEKELHKIIDQANPDSSAVKELHKNIDELGTWKKFQLERKQENYYRRDDLSAQQQTTKDRAAEEEQSKQNASEESQQETDQPTQDAPEETPSEAEASQQSNSAASPSQENQENEDVHGQNELRAIVIKPHHISLPLGNQAQLQATGIYYSGEEIDLTPLVDWKPSDNAIVAVTKGTLRTLGRGTTDLCAEFDGIKSEPALIEVTDPVLASIQLSPAHARLALEDIFFMKAEGVYSDGSRNNISDQASWIVEKQAIVKVLKGKLLPLKTGTTQIHAEYLKVKSEPAAIRIGISLMWVIKRIALVFLIACAMAVATMLGLQIITTKKKKSLFTLLSDDPRAFIIGAYENARRFIAVTGTTDNRSSSPFAYARAVEEKYKIKNGLFLRLTDTYQEAKFSSHALSRENASSFLKDYNELIKKILNHHETTQRSWFILLSLCKRLPLFIA